MSLFLSGNSLHFWWHDEWDGKRGEWNDYQSIYDEIALVHIESIGSERLVVDLGEEALRRIVYEAAKHGIVADTTGKSWNDE